MKATQKELFPRKEKNENDKRNTTFVQEQLGRNGARGKEALVSRQDFKGQGNFGAWPFHLNYR